MTIMIMTMESKCDGCCYIYIYIATFEGRLHLRQYISSRQIRARACVRARAPTRRDMNANKRKDAGTSNEQSDTRTMYKYKIVPINKVLLP